MIASSLTITIGSPSIDLDIITNDYMEREYAHNYTSFKITDNQKVNVDDTEALRFTADGLVEAIELKMLIYVFNIKDNICTFASVSSKNNADKDILELDSMFKSIKIEKAELVKTKRVGEDNYGYITI